MPGTGIKVVTLVDDQTVHLLGPDERTECGIPIPVASGATWTYAERDEAEATCKACQKVADKQPEEFDARSLDELETPLASDEKAAKNKAGAKSGGKA